MKSTAGHKPLLVYHTTSTTYKNTGKLLETNSRLANICDVQYFHHKTGTLPNYHLLFYKVNILAAAIQHVVGFLLQKKR